MQDLSLHILDLAENCARAGARRVEIGLAESAAENRLTLALADDGEGMDGETRAKAADPIFTTKPGKTTGLGLPLLKEAARQAGGSFELWSERGKGTVVTASFIRDHLDRPPLGDLAESMAVFRMTHPDIRLVFRRRLDHRAYTYDSGRWQAGQQDFCSSAFKAREWVRKHEEQLMGGL